jgi:hypothetical protein
VPDGILDPDDSGLLQGEAGAHRSVYGPGFRRIHYDRYIRTDSVTNCSDWRDLAVRMQFVVNP